MTEPRHLLRAYARLNLQLQELREAVIRKEREIANLMDKDQELDDAISHPLRCHLGFADLEVTTLRWAKLCG